MSEQEFKFFCDHVYHYIKSAEQKHGAQKTISLEKWFLILTEEVGELAETILENNANASMIEANHVLAMAFKMIQRVYAEL